MYTDDALLAKLPRLGLREHKDREQNQKIVQRGCCIPAFRLQEQEEVNSGCQP